MMSTCLFLRNGLLSPIPLPYPTAAVRAVFFVSRVATTTGAVKYGAQGQLGSVTAVESAAKGGKK
jgi:hypothetical protein